MLAYACARKCDLQIVLVGFSQHAFSRDGAYIKNITFHVHQVNLKFIAEDLTRRIFSWKGSQVLGKKQPDYHYILCFFRS